MQVGKIVNIFPKKNSLKNPYTLNKHSKLFGLVETVLLGTQNTCLVAKKMHVITFLRSKILTVPMYYTG